MFYFWKNRYLGENILVAKKTTTKETSVFIKSGKTQKKSLCKKLICAVPSAQICTEENESNVEGYNLCLINKKI